MAEFRLLNALVRLAYTERSRCNDTNNRLKTNTSPISRKPRFVHRNALPPKPLINQDGRRREQYFRAYPLSS